MPEVHRVDGDAERLDRRADSQREPGRQGIQEVGRMGEILLQRAGNRRTAEEPEVLAEVRVPLDTEPAPPAVNRRIDGHRRARGRPGRPGAERRHHPRHLVAQDVAGRQPGVTDPAVRVVVQVRAADPHRL